jgi:hypothetical protein
MEVVRVAYSVALPRTWRRLALRGNPGPAITELLLAVPEADDARARRRTELLELAQVARTGNGVDLYLPVDDLAVEAVPASFVVSLPPGAGGETRALDEVLHAIAERHGDDGREVELDGSPAVRIVRSMSGPDAPMTYLSVDYLTVIPHGFGRWLALAFTLRHDIAPDGARAQVLLECFDSIVDTFRWVV